MSNITKFALVALMGLAGCSAASGPGFSAYSVGLPDGGKAFRVQCYGLFEGPQTCRRKAQEICHGQDVRLLEDVTALGRTSGGDADTRELTFQCGSPSPGVAIAPTPAPVPAPVLPETLTLGADAAFESGRSTLTPAARGQLDQLIGRAKNLAVGTVTVSGYTDSVGSDAYNLKLSRQRAQAVAQYLQAHGLNAERFETQAHGKADPVAENDTAAGRARNRRVEVQLNLRQKA